MRKGRILARLSRLPVLTVLSRRAGLSVLSRCSWLSVFAVLPGCSRLSVFAILPVQTVGADGVALAVGQQLAVQRPIPIAVFTLGDADLRCLAVSPLCSLLAMVNGDRVGVQESDGVAHLLAALHDGRNAGDVVCSTDELLQGGNVVIGLLLPLFQRFNAVLVVVHRIPKSGVIIIVAASAQGDGQGKGSHRKNTHSLLTEKA